MHAQRGYWEHVSVSSGPRAANNSHANSHTTTDTTQASSSLSRPTTTAADNGKTAELTDSQQKAFVKSPSPSQSRQSESRAGQSGAPAQGRGQGSPQKLQLQSPSRSRIRGGCEYHDGATHDGAELQDLLRNHVQFVANSALMSDPLKSPMGKGIVGQPRRIGGMYCTEHGWIFTDLGNS